MRRTAATFRPIGCRRGPASALRVWRVARWWRSIWWRGDNVSLRSSRVALRARLYEIASRGLRGRNDREEGWGRGKGEPGGRGGQGPAGLAAATAEGIEGDHRVGVLHPGQRLHLLGDEQPDVLLSLQVELAQQVVLTGGG